MPRSPVAAAARAAPSRMAANCGGVKPRASSASSDAPLERSSATTSACPCSTALCSGVRMSPVEASCAVTVAPAAKSNWHTARCPPYAAQRGPAACTRTRARQPSHHAPAAAAPPQCARVELRSAAGCGRIRLPCWHTWVRRAQVAPRRASPAQIAKLPTRLCSAPACTGRPPRCAYGRTCPCAPHPQR
jgi:hypothetical protein